MPQLAQLGFGLYGAGSFKQYLGQQMAVILHSIWVESNYIVC